MNTENYINQEQLLPQSGNYITANYDDASITVYQAFKPEIAHYAIVNQTFGGPAFSFRRMTWIKTNFLWMMYRAGWAEKINQERILAIRLTLEGFERILKSSTHATFEPKVYTTKEKWKEALEKSEVRLQWDPSHDPFGNKMERKAIQLGIKGDMVKAYCNEWIISIEDITSFVKEQKRILDIEGEEKLIIPQEKIWIPSSEGLIDHLDLSSDR